MKHTLLIIVLLLLWFGCDKHHDPPEQPKFPGGSGVSSHSGSSWIMIPAAGTGRPGLPVQPIHLHRKSFKRSFPQLKAANQPAGDPKPYPDTLFLKKLRQMRLEDVELDLSEPLSMRYLLSGKETPGRGRYVSISRDRILSINFDNDILDNTDRYYTNGIRIDIISPFLKPFPLNWLMIPYWGSGVNYYGISIVQDMYTPSTTKIGGILYGDRPYAAVLSLGSFKISNDPVRRFRQTTELDVGVIGPYSLGGVLQKSFHAAIPTNNEPLGWLYQIQNDLILNYDLSFEKGILAGRNLEFNLAAESAVGTLFTNFGGGILFRAGLFNPYFMNLGLRQSRLHQPEELRNFQAFFYVDLSGRIIGYDATLEGGMLNHSSVYTLTGHQISRAVMKGCAGIALSAGWFRLEVGQYLLSPEFHAGMWHHWVHTGMSFAL